MPWVGTGVFRTDASAAVWWCARSVDGASGTRSQARQQPPAAPPNALQEHVPYRGFGMDMLTALQSRLHTLT